MRSPTLVCTVQSAITKFDARTERRCRQIVPSRPPLVGADAQEIDPDGTESGGENGVRGVARNEDCGGFYRQVVKVLWYHTSSEFRLQTSGGIALLWWSGSRGGRWWATFQFSATVV